MPPPKHNLNLQKWAAEVWTSSNEPGKGRSEPSVEWVRSEDADSLITLSSQFDLSQGSWERHYLKISS